MFHQTIRSITLSSAANRQASKSRNKVKSIHNGFQFLKIKKSRRLTKKVFRHNI